MFIPEQEILPPSINRASDYFMGFHMHVQRTAAEKHIQTSISATYICMGARPTVKCVNLVLYGSDKYYLDTTGGFRNLYNRCRQHLQVDVDLNSDISIIIIRKMKWMLLLLFFLPIHISIPLTRNVILMHSIRR